MEVIPLHRVQSQAMREIFEEERQCWAEKLLWDYAEPLNVVSSMLEFKSLSGYAAVDDGLPVGYCYFLEVDRTGLVGNCFVRNSQAGKGVEEKLLGKVIWELQNVRSVCRIESQFISFHPWGVREFFKSFHFVGYDRTFRQAPCKAALPKPVPSIGFRPWTLGIFEEAAKITTEAYQSLVDSKISIHYQSLTGCKGFLSSLILRPGCGRFLDEASVVAWDEANDRLAGFVLVSEISAHCGHIPQIAIRKELQGKGIGTLLLSQAILNLSERGFHSVSLSVSEVNTAAATLYRKLGFQTVLSFQAFVWER